LHIAFDNPISYGNMTFRQESAFAEVGRFEKGGALERAVRTDEH
jgi:hypothetical protein